MFVGTKVEGEPDLVKDPKSKGIINTLLKNAISKGCKSCEASRTKAAAKDAQKPDTIITIVASINIDELLSKSFKFLII